MSRQAWAAVGLVAVGLAALVLRYLVWPETFVMYFVAEAIGSLASAVLGAVIVARVTRRNAGNAPPGAATVAWLMVASGVSGLVNDLTLTYAYRGLIESPGSLPGAHWAAWIDAWIWVPGYNAGLFVLPLLFPNGRVPSPRWRPVLYFILGLFTVQFFWGMFRPGDILLPDPTTGMHIPYATNPVGVAALTPLVPYIDALFTGASFFPLLIVAALSIIMRYRHARGVERYQLRWFMFAVAIAPFAFAIFVLGGITGYPALGNLVAGILLLGVPASIAIAVLRYRLYEIDRIISRTVTYALVTAVLAAVYVVISVVPTTVFAIESDLLVASATLAAAGIFVPVRRHVQAAVDRRFNRAKYDSANVIDRYAERLRDDVDLESITSDLRDVVSTTVQPARMSIWLHDMKRV